MSGSLRIWILRGAVVLLVFFFFFFFFFFSWGMRSSAELNGS